MQRNLENLAHACSVAGLELVSDKSHIQLKRGLKFTPNWSVAYWTPDDVDLLECMIWEYNDGNVTWDCLVHYEDSMRDSEDGYVIDSYRLGHDKMMSIVDTAFKGCGYSQELMNKIESIDFNKSSARLINDLYITPCMLKSAINQVVKSLSNEQLIELSILLFGINQKVDKIIDCISEDTWDKLGCNEDLEKLSYLDVVRMI